MPLKINLQETLSFYYKKIRATINDKGYHAHANAAYILLYLNVYRGYYEKHEELVPIDELITLVEIVEKIELSEFGEKEVYRNHGWDLRTNEKYELHATIGLIYSLLQEIIFFIDIISCRFPDKDLLPIVKRVVIKIPQASQKRRELNIAEFTMSDWKEITKEIRAPIERSYKNQENTTKRNIVINIPTLKEAVPDDSFEKLHNKEYVFSPNDLSILMNQFIRAASLYDPCANDYSKENESSGLPTTYNFFNNFIDPLYTKYNNASCFVNDFFTAHIKVNQRYNAELSEEYMMKDYQEQLWDLFFKYIFDNLIDILPHHDFVDLINNMAELYLSDNNEYNQEIATVIFLFSNKESNNFENISLKFKRYGLGYNHNFDTLFSLALLISDIRPPLNIVKKRRDDVVFYEKSSVLSRLPLLMQEKLRVISEENKNLEIAFESFVELFIKVNTNADQIHQKPITLFFLTHYIPIIQIIQVMGIAGISYMRAFLAFSVLPLDRALSNFLTLSDDVSNKAKNYLASCMQTLTQKETTAFITCLSVLNLLAKETSLDYFSLFLGRTPIEFLTALMTKLLELFFENDTEIILTHDTVNEILTRFDFYQLFCLIKASKEMKSKEYNDVYLKFLKMDFLNKNIYFNTKEKNSIMQKLLAHNLRIQKALQEKGINPENALRYKKMFDFSVNLNNSSLSSNESLVFSTLLSYIQRLTEVVRNYNDRPSILTKTVNFLEKLEKNKTDNRSLGNLIVELKNLSTQSECMLLTEFKEFSRHIQDQYGLLIMFKKKKGMVGNFSFKVMQWEKERADTFFLGDDVGCCLASTGAKFEAMIQRRMDDAMLFHVAINNDTKKPAALIWLYFAETANKKIVLVANFFEVHAKYGENDILRLALLNGLLQFTHQYLNDNPNIDAFYMNQLAYGWNVCDLDDYPLETVILRDKLGGPFVPDADESLGLSEDTELTQMVKTLTKEKYYLASLERTSFHRFDPKHMQLIKKENKSWGIFSKSQTRVFSSTIRCGCC